MGSPAIMIDPATLTEKDVGRNVTYHREHCAREFGKLSSWTATTVFVRFKGPNGEGCQPEDVSFDSIGEQPSRDAYELKRLGLG